MAVILCTQYERSQTLKYVHITPRRNIPGDVPEANFDTLAGDRTQR